MCGTKEILLKNVRDKGNPIEKMCGTKEILLKSWKKPHNLSPILAPAPGTLEILEKTSQSADHPLDLRKSWKKPHNLRTIPGTAGNPGKKPHNITDLLVVGWLLVGSDKLCRGPLRGQKCAGQRESY